jgi:hypothetical protein
LPRRLTLWRKVEAAVRLAPFQFHSGPEIYLIA